MRKAEYFSKDFDWDELRVQVENDPSFSYHLLPFQPNPISISLADETHYAAAGSHAWNAFHHRHASGKFFKERRYLLEEFPELVNCKENSKVLEVGCGNGSTVLPILRGNENIIVYACDCSNEALERVKETVYASNKVSFEHRFHPFCCDFSVTAFPTWLACNPCQENIAQTQQVCFSDGRGKSEKNLNDSYSLSESRCCIGGVDFVTLIFTLSALPLQRMPESIKECFSVLEPGGLLFFRDYGLYDMSMLRFEMDKRVGFREYMRSDGTRSYFFCLDTVRNLFVGAGFTELELEYCCVKSVNRRNGKSMRRVWVHGKFQKPV
ncbi:methyltransferase-like protein 6 [Prunus yedoensis var. nudiflora]|uniref:tRNA N(3)-methylcytidine methyltransferase n=1 Tax=Prunus yedoensis var. nudiflora TaxID=2094558 RepID=A0A314XLT9_PRUYE|nr:methyltransferase-like protein 6 [Prunus yedoensis var. nudiflora]